jgi:hypothetical protein
MKSTCPGLEAPHPVKRVEMAAKHGLIIASYVQATRDIDSLYTKHTDHVRGIHAVFFSDGPLTHQPCRQALLSHFSTVLRPVEIGHSIHLPGSQKS